jgi:hypothetical protein
MFANFDYSTFPVVLVDLSGTINSDTQITHFTENWLKLYEDKREFEFIFETQNMCSAFISPKYCLYVAFFIRSLKKEKIQYLKKSKIYVYNKYIFQLLKIIFIIEKPIAQVELIFINSNNERIVENINI